LLLGLSRPINTGLFESRNSLMTPSPKPGILDITPYVGGRAGVPGVTKVFKLSSNESPLGPSPAALAALDTAKASLSLYPEVSAALLR